ncbi:Hpt domain-containing protein, partial [Tepidimonas sp.]
PSPAPAEAVLGAPWPEAERVDVPAALARLGDDPALYARIVRGFVQGLAHTQAQLQAQLDAGTDERLAALLHTLKGTAGTVGAVRLAERAAEAERAVKAALAEPVGPRAPLPPWWPALTEELAQTERALQAVLAELQVRGLVAAEAPLDEAASQQADPARWRETLQRLAALLAASDMEALEVHDALLAEPAVAQDERWAALHRAMEAMDFAAAHAAAEALLRTVQGGGADGAA